jgi:hypothetical protein
MLLVGLSVLFLVIAAATGQSFAIAAFITLVVFEALLIVAPVVLWRKVRRSPQRAVHEFGRRHEGRQRVAQHCRSYIASAGRWATIVSSPRRASRSSSAARVRPAG